jgi:hypothetical protein
VLLATGAPILFLFLLRVLPEQFRMLTARRSSA